MFAFGLQATVALCGQMSTVSDNTFVVHVHVYIDCRSSSFAICKRGHFALKLASLALSGL
jgi:hypothetical protein